jgi:hypothetical protein
MTELNKTTGMFTTYDQGGCCGIGRKKMAEKGEKGVIVPSRTFPLNEIIGCFSHIVIDHQNAHVSHTNGGIEHHTASDQWSFDTKIWRNNGKCYSVCDHSGKIGGLLAAVECPLPVHEVREKIKSFLGLPPCPPHPQLAHYIFRDNWLCPHPGQEAMMGGFAQTTLSQPVAIPGMFNYYHQHNIPYRVDRS